MTARAKGRRQKNAAIKREKNKIKELQRLRKLVGKMDTDDLTDHNTVNVVQYERRRKQQEVELIKEQFIEEKTGGGPGQKVAIVNPNTKKKHVYSTKTMKDQFGNYPVWYKPHKEKRKANKRKVATKCDTRSGFWTGSYMQV